MKGLHSLRPAPKSVRKKTRVGRGSGSGIGTYSGRGIKGQKARSGGKSGLTARSMRPYLLRIPKARGKGFKPARPPMALVTTGQLQKHFNEGDMITPKLLRMRGIVTGSQDRVKILSGGALSKKLQVTAHAFSASAKELLEKAGGAATVQTVAKPVPAPKKRA